MFWRELATTVYHSVTSPAGKMLFTCSHHDNKNLGLISHYMCTLIERIFALAKALITKQTNNSAMKIFSCLFLESKFSAFWPNSVGLISKTIQPIYPKFCTELAKGVNHINVLGIFVYLRGSGEILQKLPVVDAKQQFQLSNSIKKVTCLNANRWNVIVNQFSFILMENK